MYIVKIKNGNIETTIHGEKQKLHSGKVVHGINAIDSFTFSLLPSNVGFNLLREYKTLVSVYNTRRSRYEFFGRVLYPQDGMDESGAITKEVICESYFGFLCDSKQLYVETRNWTVDGLLQHLIDCHNSQVEEYKHFVLGEITVTDPNNNLYVGISRESTWDSIKSNLLDKLGGELRFRVVGGVIYLDYLKEIGETKSTPIALSRNMKSITREKNPSEYVTRLIPLGCKLSKEVTTTDDEGNTSTEMVETEERLDISSVNDGKNYIDDEEAIEAYGIHVSDIEFDDVTEAANLLNKGKAWLKENNRILIKYSITALDLSLLGLDIDDFSAHNYHPVKNRLLGIDDIARIVKKSTDIVEETKSTIEVGDNFKSLSDIQLEQAGNIHDAVNTIEKIESNYVTNQILTSTENTLKSLIDQTAERISLLVSSEYVSISDNESYRQEIATQLQILSDEILMKFTTVTETVETVNGETSSKFEEIYKYISFNDGNITLGERGNEVTLTIENDMICFKKNGVSFGHWDGENFYTGNIVVQVNERAQFGNFAFIPRSDGSLMFLKVGD